jgi:hypothetical protein
MTQGIIFLLKKTHITKAGTIKFPYLKTLSTDIQNPSSPDSLIQSAGWKAISLFIQWCIQGYNLFTIIDL